MIKVESWTLENALQFIRKIQSDVLESGYYIALAGGVLNNGSSEHDLDLVAFPRSESSDIYKLVGALMNHAIYVNSAKQYPNAAHWKCHYLPGKNKTFAVEVAIPSNGSPSTLVDPVAFRFD